MKQKQTIIMVILCAAVIALGGATVNGYMTANRYKTNLDYNYQREMCIRDRSMVSPGRKTPNSATVNACVPLTKLYRTNASSAPNALA